MSSHVTILHPASGAVSITPQASCGYLYERFEGDAAALQYNATSAVPTPPDPSWGEQPFKGIILENVNLATTQATVAYDAHFAVQGGTLTIPPSSFAHIWLVPEGGVLKELSRSTGAIPPSAHAAWIKARAAQPIQKEVKKAPAVAGKA